MADPRIEVSQGWGEGACPSAPGSANCIGLLLNASKMHRTCNSRAEKFNLQSKTIIKDMSLSKQKTCLIDSRPL